MDQIIFEMILVAFSTAIGATIGFVHSVVAITVWFLSSIFVGLVRLSLVSIEFADECWPDLEIVDRFWMRGLVILAIGVVFSVALLWLGYFFKGTWVVSVVAILIDLLSFTLGAIADPEKAWIMPPFPTLGRKGEEVGINL
jgi:hypothetical protein